MHLGCYKRTNLTKVAAAIVVILGTALNLAGCHCDNSGPCSTNKECGDCRQCLNGVCVCAEGCRAAGKNRCIHPDAGPYSDGPRVDSPHVDVPLWDSWPADHTDTDRANTDADSGQGIPDRESGPDRADAAVEDRSPQEDATAADTALREDAWLPDHRVEDARREDSGSEDVLRDICAPAVTSLNINQLRVTGAQTTPILTDLDFSTSSLHKDIATLQFGPIGVYEGSGQVQIKQVSSQGERFSQCLDTENVVWFTCGVFQLSSLTCVGNVTCGPVECYWMRLYNVSPQHISGRAHIATTNTAGEVHMGDFRFEVCAADGGSSFRACP